MFASEPRESEKNENGTSDFVVQPTLIPVPDHRGNHETQQQRAHERSPYAYPAASQRNYAHPEHHVSDAAVNKYQEQHLCCGENRQSSECVVLEKRDRHDNAQAPINDQCPQPAAKSRNRSWARFGQPEPLPRPTLFFGGRVVIGSRHHPILGEPRNKAETQGLRSRNRVNIFFKRLQSAAGARIITRESVHV